MFLTSHSRILLSLLLLGCSPLALADTLATHEGLWDDCDHKFILGHWRCGDKCVTSYDLCDCGGTKLRWELFPRYQCCTNTNCTQSSGRVSCPGGQVFEIKDSCEDGRCFRDATMFPFPYRSHYSCPRTRYCLPSHHMCAGLSYCGDSQACNEELRCERGKIIRLNTSQVQHSFCQYSRDEGDRSYTSIDRSDENIISTINIKESPRIDYSYLTPCDSRNGPGLTCYNNTLLELECLPLAGWCRSDFPFSCVTSQDGRKTVTDDRSLCSNKTFWRNIGTDFFIRPWFGRGVRCNGSLMHTIYPWYKSINGETLSSLKQNCDDQSDKVFTVGKPCPNRTNYLEVHHSVFCSDDNASYYKKHYITFSGVIRNKLICTNSSAWMEKITETEQLAWLDDPHFCQESCATPGLNCIACKNVTYFNCSRSNTCIHPDLECDGHPQCPNNEDEDYEMCWQKYFDKGLVKPFASFKCNSTMYPYIFTITTACNGIPECLNGLDEDNCSTDSVTTPILVGAIILVLGLFFGLKILYYIDYIEYINKNKNGARQEKYQFKELIQRLRKNTGDQENNKKNNTFLLHILHTKETKFSKVVLIKFYDILETAFENKEEEVFCYLKRNMQLDVTKAFMTHKSQGLMMKINDFIEKHIRSPSPFIEFQDKVTSTPSLRMKLSTLGTLLSLPSPFADIVKDASLAVSLLVITGGPDAIAEFPTNFSSAIVISWMVTIIIPIIISSLNLALTQPFLVFPGLRATRGGRALAALGCLVLSPLNTVILKTRLEMTQERAIEAARVLGADTLDLYNQCNVLEAKVQEYLQIEIGD